MDLTQAMSETTCADPGVFVGGGGGGGGAGQSDQKSSDNVFFFFCFRFCFSPQLILQFRRKQSFFKVQEGVQLFQGVQLLIPRFPVETHMTWDFQGGGSGQPVPPPLDPHLD